MIVVPRNRRQAGITLVELVVSIAIMGIISTMILGTWFALSDSYLHTSRSNEQIDYARQAISRMAREIRDAQGVLGGTDVPVPFVRTSSNEIRFYSTFNTADAATPTSAPRLTRFIYHVTDTSQGIGSIYREVAADGLFDDSPGDVSTVLVSNVANGATTDVFVYWAYASSGPLSGTLYHSSGTDPLVSPSEMVSVGINLLIDVNPGKSPNYTDVSTTVNPRNVRQF
jgi:hypothetical protein